MSFHINYIYLRKNIKIVTQKINKLMSFFHAPVLPFLLSVCPFSVIITVRLGGWYK